MAETKKAKDFKDKYYVLVLFDKKTFEKLEERRIANSRSRTAEISHIVKKVLAEEK